MENETTMKLDEKKFNEFLQKNKENIYKTAKQNLKLCHKVTQPSITKDDEWRSENWN